VTTLLAVVLASVALAADERGDLLVVGAEKHAIETHPLEPYLEAHPERRPESEVGSTALARGYVATWSLEGERLLLIDVQVLRQRGLHSVMSAVFPGRSRVLADWFSGHVIAPFGKRLEEVQTDPGSTYEGYTVYTVVRGVLDKERQMSAGEFRRFREQQFRAYRRTEEYAAASGRLELEGHGKAEVESILYRAAGARYLSMIFEEGSQP
jgi:hypothetical protein